jgi:hypothetical protein
MPFSQGEPPITALSYGEPSAVQSAWEWSGVSRNARTYLEMLLSQLGDLAEKFLTSGPLTVEKVRVPCRTRYDENAALGAPEAHSITGT